MDIGDEAVEVANAIENACRGRSTAAVYVAISMVLGRAASSAERPDLPRLMKLIERGARAEFERALAEAR